MNNHTNYIQQNKLINQWQNMQSYNPTYQNNTLLQNNKYIQQTMQNKMQQMQYIQQMQQLRKIQLMQQMQNKIKQYTKNLLEPINVKEDNSKVKDNYLKLNKIRDKEKKSTKIIDNAGQELKIDNTPYKQIMTQKEYGGEDYKKTHSKKTFNKEILVHKVNKNDKNISLFEQQLAEKEKKVKKYDQTLEKIYADEKKEEHIKKFEYRKTYVYRQLNDDVNPDNHLDHTNMKKEIFKTYEKQQKEWETDNIKVNNVVQNLKDTGILTEDQVNNTMDILENEI